MTLILYASIAGAAGPNALVRAPTSRSSTRSSFDSLPSPTATHAPTRARTMLWQNASA